MTDKEFQDRLLNELNGMGIGQRKWHTDKGIPLAVLLMFAGQLMWAAWYSSSVASEVKVNGVEIEEIKTTHITKTDAALFEQTININQALILEVRKDVRKNSESAYRIEKKLDIFIERQHGNNDEDKRYLSTP